MRLDRGAEPACGLLVGERQRTLLGSPAAEALGDDPAEASVRKMVAVEPYRSADVIALMLGRSVVPAQTNWA